MEKSFKFRGGVATCTVSLYDPSFLRIVEFSRVFPRDIPHTRLYLSTKTSKCALNPTGVFGDLLVSQTAVIEI